MKTPVLTLILWSALWLAPAAHAYPNFYAYGYQSCMGCHYNPMGGGPLTDYGRVVAATLISDRQLWSAGKTDEQLEAQSGFAFQEPMVEWLRPQANFRELWLRMDQGKADQSSRFITMDASVDLVAKFLTDDRLTLVGNIGYAPTPIEAEGSSQSYQNYRSRELYVGYRITKEWGVYTGLMDKAFGIRVPDHEAYSRSVTDLNEDDQTYGVMVHYLKDKWEAVVQPFLGNFVQDASLRQKGVTTQVGYNLSESARIGGSILKSSSDYLNMFMYSLDARISPAKGFSILGEVGQVEKTITGTAKNVSRYVFLQNHWPVRPGLYTLLTVEMLQPDSGDSSQTFRFGPGIQYFMAEGVEWRADVYDTRNYESSTDATDSWMVTAQLHLWF